MDRPSIKSHVIAGQVIYADVWKIFQGIPGKDYIRFKYATLEEAIKARRELKTILSNPDKVLKRS
jgi:allophanate hydrolase subunit 2